MEPTSTLGHGYLVAVLTLLVDRSFYGALLELSRIGLAMLGHALGRRSKQIYTGTWSIRSREPGSEQTYVQLHGLMSILLSTEKIGLNFMPLVSETFQMASAYLNSNVASSIVMPYLRPRNRV